jgi:hypothetical protein
VSRVKSVAVPSGTVYDIDVDPTNKYMITSGQVVEKQAFVGVRSRLFETEANGGSCHQ